MELPRKTWVRFNHIPAGQGRCNQLLNKWNLRDNPNYDCEEVQSIDHIIKTARLDDTQERWITFSKLQTRLLNR